MDRALGAMRGPYRGLSGPGPSPCMRCPICPRKVTSRAAGSVHDSASPAGDATERVKRLLEGRHADHRDACRARPRRRRPGRPGRGKVCAPAGGRGAALASMPPISPTLPSMSMSRCRRSYGRRRRRSATAGRRRSARSSAPPKGPRRRGVDRHWHVELDVDVRRVDDDAEPAGVGRSGRHGDVCGWWPGRPLTVQVIGSPAAAWMAADKPSVDETVVPSTAVMRSPARSTLAAGLASSTWTTSSTVAGGGDLQAERLLGDGRGDLAAVDVGRLLDGVVRRHRHAGGWTSRSGTIVAGSPVTAWMISSP